MSGLTTSFRHSRLAWPGVFVANHPLLSLTLVFAALGAIGFSDGYLSVVENRAQMNLYAEKLWAALLRLVLLFGLLFLAPSRVWSQAFFAGFAFLMSLVWLNGTGHIVMPWQEPVVTQGALSPALSGAFLLLVLIIPFCSTWVGRRAAGLMLAAPIFGIFPLIALTGYLLRKNILGAVPLPILYALGLGVSVLMCVAYAYRFLDRIAEGDSPALASAISLNITFRDCLFLSLSCAGLFAFYVRDMRAIAEFMPLAAAGFLLVGLCSIVALVGAAVLSSYVPARDGFVRELERRALGYKRFTMFLDLRVTPVMYLAALVITVMLALTFMMESPMAAYTGTTSVSAPVAKLLFLALMMAGAAYAYKSMRVALVIGISFLLADVLSTAFFAKMILAGEGALSLTDVLPRLFALALAAVLAESWHQYVDVAGRYGRGRTLVKAALVTGLPRFLGGFLGVMMVVCAFSLWLPPADPDAVVQMEPHFSAYAVLRFEVEALLVLIITPMVLMTISRMRFTL